MRPIGNLFTSKRHVGDRVCHRVTNRFGTVEGVETMNGTDLLTVKLDCGLYIHKADRREFMTIGRNERQ